MYPSTIGRFSRSVGFATPTLVHILYNDPQLIVFLYHIRGGQTFPKSMEFRNSRAFCPFFGCPFPCFSVHVAESVS